MNLRSLMLCVSATAFLAAGPTAAEEPATTPIRLVAQPAISAQLAAFPRVAEPVGPQEQRVNQALTNADARVRAAAAQCHEAAIEAQADAGDAGWQRSVTVAMRGPRYLAVVASDSWYCGGPYPSAASFALAYDLRTGAPLNWERLLPKALVHTAALNSAGDGTRLGVVASPALKALYMKVAKVESDCVPVLQDADLQFILWPDAQREGVALEPSGLAHAIAACGPDAVIPLPTLRQLGAEPALLDAISAAHKARLYGLAP